MNDLNSVLLEGTVTKVRDYTMEPDHPAAKLIVDVQYDRCLSQFIVFARGKIADRVAHLPVGSRVRVVGRLEQGPSLPTCVIAEHIEVRRPYPTEEEIIE